MFRKVLIANRGEIAVRIIRTLREMDIRTVAVYSDVDRASLHVRKADEASHIGPAPSSQSYLNIPRIIDAARRHNVDAIHPGYGFLSENFDFARACEDAGFIFIGPSSNCIRRVGSKTGGRQVAVAAGAPVVPGAHHGSLDPSQTRDFARAVKYPIMLKAVAGGGGKGMRRVDREEDLDSAFRDASSEARRAFGDGAIYVEKLIEDPRHIEIQIFGDHHGNVIHLGERECSVQRRHQKVIEECPSPLMLQYPEMRERMGDAAVRIAKEAGYFNAGTIEFLVDGDRNFYFIEMNTRLQVEHPTTELATGTDLVRWQLAVAEGARLPMTQDQIQWRGSAIECRIYAEDPDNQFFPSPGAIERLVEPGGPGVRVDSGVYPGWNVPLDYDPMLAKLIAWSSERSHTIARLRRAIDEYRVSGIRTNLSFFKRVLTDREFQEGKLDTGFLDRFFARSPEPVDPAEDMLALAAAAVRHHATLRQQISVDGERTVSPWLLAGRDQLQR